MRDQPSVSFFCGVCKQVVYHNDEDKCDQFIPLEHTRCHGEPLRYAVVYTDPALGVVIEYYNCSNDSTWYSIMAKCGNINSLSMESNAFLKSMKVATSGSWWSWWASNIRRRIYIFCTQLLVPDFFLGWDGQMVLFCSEGTCCRFCVQLTPVCSLYSWSSESSHSSWGQGRSGQWSTGFVVCV